MSKNNNYKKVGEIVSKSKINFREAADNTEKKHLKTWKTYRDLESYGIDSYGIILTVFLNLGFRKLIENNTHPKAFPNIILALRLFSQL